jgi:hypothetical protein
MYVGAALGEQLGLIDGTYKKGKISDFTICCNEYISRDTIFEVTCKMNG